MPITTFEMAQNAITQAGSKATATAKSVKKSKKSKGKGAGWNALLNEVKGMNVGKLFGGKRPEKDTAPKPDTAFSSSYNKDFVVTSKRQPKLSMPNWLLPAIGIAAITFFTFRKTKQ